VAVAGKMVVVPWLVRQFSFVMTALN